MRTMAAAALVLLALIIWLAYIGVFDPTPVTKVERPLVVPCGGGGSVGAPQMTR